jgi:hypothetical protein
VTIQAAPHSLPSDGPVNPAFTSAANPHTQYPFAELRTRDQATNSGGHEGNATVDPAGE